MKKGDINNKKFYLQLVGITIVSSLIIVLMTGYVNKQISALPESGLGDNLSLLKFGVFINSYPAVERLADYYHSKELECQSTREALGIFLGYACKGYFGKSGLEKAKSYRNDFLSARKDCSKGLFPATRFVFSCQNPNQGGEHDIIGENNLNEPFRF